MLDPSKNRELYAIARGRNWDELHKTVEEMQVRGWKCAGGICVVTGFWRRWRFYQAMTAFGQRLETENQEQKL